ncbi:hypothetical protein [Halosolutus gelatinilyticus]|uniref:hypothetical protein n=1 Tax=Halosolutus gelatinilyticus TaxID=2931975 RepID=UPI001FF49B5D|nr:hypothetical protein [Halosolutus gelatinilyticus]
MSDDRPPDDPDDRADGPTAPDDDSPADEPRERDAPGDRRDDDPSPDAPRDGEIDGGYGDDRRQERADDERAPDPDQPNEAETETQDGSNRVAFWTSALIALVLAVGAIALVSGRAPFFENVLRVRPTVEGGGVGADWVVGNTGPLLDLAIALVHLADVVMGIFILVMVFIHWAAFRRLAARMQPPERATRSGETTAATDGGERTRGPLDRDRSDREPADDRSGSGGEPS